MKKIFILAAATLSLAACDNNEENPVTSSTEAAKITATIEGSVTSRVSDQSWDVNDQIGISSTVGGKPGPYINVQYTTTTKDDATTGKFTGTELFFYKPMTLTAYYPFTGEETKVPGVDGVIAANTLPENQESDTQRKIDFLWDSQTGFTATDTNVNFKFTHKMSKITFTFQSSDPFFDEQGVKIADGVDVGTMISYKLEELGVEGTFNTADGVCAIDESKHDGLEINFAKETTEMKERNFPSVIVFPQSLNGGSLKLHITTDELNRPDALQHYNCNLSFSEGEIKPGYHYKYTIKVTKVGLIVGKMTVAPWQEESRFMTATIDGEKVFEENN